MKKKIIGYRLLKDLPFADKGSIYKYSREKNGFVTVGDPNTYTDYDLDILTEWFEPVFEKTQDELAYEIIESVQIDKDFDSLDRHEVQNVINKLLDKYEIIEKV